MGALMDLVAGDSRSILVAISTDDLAGQANRARFTAHLALDSGLDPTWFDLFSEAARTISGSDRPTDFLDARRELEGPVDTGGRTVERVDAHWIDAIARLADHDLTAVSGRWLDLLEEEYREPPSEEKPWIRELAGEIVRFCRAAESAPDVLFAWSL